MNKAIDDYDFLEIYSVIDGENGSNPTCVGGIMVIDNSLGTIQYTVSDPTQTGTYCKLTFYKSLTDVNVVTPSSNYAIVHKIYGVKLG